MRLKALVAISSVLACGAFTSAYAASGNSMLSAGGTYVNLGMGIGGADVNAQSQLTSLIGGLIPTSANAQANSSFNLSADTNNSGFSFRFAVGHLYAINNRLLIGAELGYSNYANQSKNYNFGGNHAPSGSKGGIKVGLGVNDIQGIDLLMNITYMFTNTLSVYVEPGMQYAMQKANFDISSSGTVPPAPAPVPSSGDASLPLSVQSSAFVPEVIIGTNFQVMSETPLFIGAYYQQVFGNNTSDATKLISDRSQVGVSLTYSFGANK